MDHIPLADKLHVPHVLEVMNAPIKPSVRFSVELETTRQTRVWHVKPVMQATIARLMVWQSRDRAHQDGIRQELGPHHALNVQKVGPEIHYVTFNLNNGRKISTHECTLMCNFKFRSQVCGPYSNWGGLWCWYISRCHGNGNLQRRKYHFIK